MYWGRRQLKKICYLHKKLQKVLFVIQSVTIVHECLLNLKHRNINTT